MTNRPTTEWVDIGRLVAHPDNPNRMNDEEFAKLEANVGPDGQMPPLIVRSLELTQAFDEERQLDKLQIIDGEHRWILAKKRNDSTIEVRVWCDVTDQKAKQLLLTLNRLHGRDDKLRRGKLIQDLYDIEPDHEVLSTILPETSKQIETILEEINREAVENATSKARKISERHPMTIFVLPDQAEQIRRAIKIAKANMGESLTDCEEGEALAIVAGRFLESEA